MTVRILVGDVRDMLARLPDESVHCCVTSPPYYGLRDYGTPGQLGLEPTPAEYIETMVVAFREVRRVLRRDGTVWLNLGDSYNAHPGQRKTTDKVGAKQETNAGSNSTPSRYVAACKPKDLLGIPWAPAFALRDDGWYLRSEIIWAKRAPMPESVTDRPTSAHEKVFLLSKSPRYFYDAEGVREPVSESTIARWDGVPAKKRPDGLSSDKFVPGENTCGVNPNGRNMRNVWHLGPEPYADAHFACFVTEIPRRAILAGTSAKGVCPTCGAPWVPVVEKSFAMTKRGGQSAKAGEKGLALGGWETPRGVNNSVTIGWQPTCSCNAGTPIPATILDPFFGAGTTGLVADQLGRDCIGIELNESYARMAEARIRNDAGMFAQIEVPERAAPPARTGKMTNL